MYFLLQKPILLSDMCKSNYSDEVNRISLLQDDEFETRPLKPVGSLVNWYL